MVGILVLVRGLRQRDQLGDVCEAIAVERGEMPAFGVHAVHARELGDAQDRLHVRHVELETGFDHLRLRGTAHGLAVVGVDAEAVEFEAADAVRELGIVRGEHAALARGDVLDRVEREHHVPVLSDAFALELGAERVRGVLNEHDVVSGGDGADLVKLQHAAREMDRDDRLRARRDRRLDRVRRDHERVAVAVDEDRLRAVQGNDVRQGDPRHGGRDDLVAGLQAERTEQHLHDGRLGRHRDRVLRAGVGAESLFEFGVLRAGGDPAGTQHIGDLGNLPFLDRGLGERQKCFAHKKNPV